MLKKIISVIALVVAISSAAVFAAKQKTKSYDASDENYQWYEFSAYALGKKYKFFAFRNDAQLANRGPQILDKKGWGMEPEETIEERFNFEGAEETALFDEELKPQMKGKGYKYACTIYKSNLSGETRIHLLSFKYDPETDTLLVVQSSK